MDVLERFGMADCNPLSTPLSLGTVLTQQTPEQTEKDKEFMADKPYREVVGALNYLSTMTRPDISYTVGLLARSAVNPGKQHWGVVQHLLRYLKGSLDLKLTFTLSSSPSPSLFTTYSDASHMDDRDEGYSTGSYLVTVGGGAIS